MELEEWLSMGSRADEHSVFHFGKYSKLRVAHVMAMAACPDMRKLIQSWLAEAFPVSQFQGDERPPSYHRALKAMLTHGESDCEVCLAALVAKRLED
jgi:hypothetical protein